MNEFQMYEQLRAYQLHCERIQSQHAAVPKHEIQNSPIPKLQKAKQYHKLKKQQQINLGNEMIMQKLISINKRKSHSHSSPNLLLPPIKKNQFQIPLYQSQNNHIAKKIISSKSHINLQNQLKGYRTSLEHVRRISKYQVAGLGPSINKKKYIAEMLLLKKIKNSRVINPQI